MVGYNRFQSGTDVATKAAAVTKSDATVLNARALWIGTAGTINLVDLDGNTLTDFPAKAGLLPLAVNKVKTGGTADDIWALY